MTLSDAPEQRRNWVSAVAAHDLLVLRILVSKLLDQWIDVGFVGLVPVGLDLPLATVPLHDARPVGAHVVAAGSLHAL